uniref:Guanine nucleotide-binding protein-like 1 n=1 Tax=Clastoptera arizonana TaxID=38151 RepID=A0A1B6C3N2_9HEMI
MPKKPFSGKAKKQQLQLKKQSKLCNIQGISNKNAVTLLTKKQDDSDNEFDLPICQKINAQPKVRGGRGKPNRYVLQFYQETEKEIKTKKEAAKQKLELSLEDSLEINIDDYFEPALDFPKRPPWNFEMTREQLEAREHKYFMEYIETLEKLYDFSKLSYFELNLETWRQLWRVLEISDVILLIVDIRFPALMFPPSLHSFIKGIKKDMILILNKIDLAPAPLVVAWLHYFKEKFSDLEVLCFTSYPGYNIQSRNKTVIKNSKRKGRFRMAAEGAEKLLQVCQNITQGKVDLTSWKTKITEEKTLEYECDEVKIEVGKTIISKVDTSYEECPKFNGNILTIGCIGQPNAGKSSLINAIMGKKVVSVSRTPGHTKHFQTIFLTNNVRLCDCPGLVFPSKVPKTLQILMGSYPIAQLREPFSAIRFLAEHVDLVKTLKIVHPDGDDTWSALDICDGWAHKRGFRTAKAARLDTHRAANNLLRMALDGRIILCLVPPKYTSLKDYWQNHVDVPSVLYIQANSEEQRQYLEAEYSEISKEESEDDYNESENTSDFDHSSDDSEESSDGMTMTNKFNVLSNIQ